MTKFTSFLEEGDFARPVLTLAPVMPHAKPQRRKAKRVTTKGTKRTKGARR